MQKVNTLKSAGLLISIALIFIFCVSTSSAQEKIKIAGKMSNTVTEDYKIKVADAEDHTFSINKSEGTNISSGENSFMDSAAVVNHNFGDLIKGNGTHQGYVILSKEGDTVIGKWKGKVTTTISSDNTPIITFEGTYTYTSGKGRFENIQGNGTYKGKYTSEKTYTAEWEGEYFTKVTK